MVMLLVLVVLLVVLLSIMVLLLLLLRVLAMGYVRDVADAQLLLHEICALAVGQNRVVWAVFGDLQKLSRGHGGAACCTRCRAMSVFGTGPLPSWGACWSAIMCTSISTVCSWSRSPRALPKGARWGRCCFRATWMS